VAIGWILKGTALGLWLGGLMFFVFGGLVGALGLGLMLSGVTAYAAVAFAEVWRLLYYSAAI
jgi:hypothetical protein